MFVLTAISNQFHQVWMRKLPQEYDFCLKILKTVNQSYGEYEAFHINEGKGNAEMVSQCR
jgi:hypothetical protein